MVEYIERRFAVDAIADLMATGFVEDRFIMPAELQALKDELEALPSTDAAPVRRGRWIYCLWIEKYQCDQCKHYVKPGTDRNYCPNCGAKMALQGWAERAD